MAGSLSVLLSIVVAGIADGADPDLINLEIGHRKDDPRHSDHLGDLTYLRGDEEERQRLLEALERVDDWLGDSTFWQPEVPTSSDEAALAVTQRALDRLTMDIATEQRTPGSAEFVDAWTRRFATRFVESNDDGNPVFDGEAVSIDVLGDSVGLHLGFAHAAMGKIWGAFSATSTVEMARLVAKRAVLWRSFNDVSYSLYPWEQAINGLRLRFGSLDHIPSMLFIVAHPSVAVELSGIEGDRWEDLRASEIFLLEFGAQFLRRSGSSGEGPFTRGFGVGAVLGFADDRRVGYGLLLHYGTTIHLGGMVRLEEHDDEVYSALVGLDLYGLLRD
jgi:hypothetical protein